MKKRGFTLVELLIVIALIGILSVAVLSTINPIEQSNKARDSAQKNDASEILSAIERYFASQSEYPWVAYDDGVTYTTNDAAISLPAEDPYIGICDTDCGSADTGGLLITSDELKSAFMNKGFLSDDDLLDKVYAYKVLSSSSVHVCFVPRSRAFRTVSDVNPLWDMGDFSGNVPSQMVVGTQDGAGGGTCPEPNGTGWSAISTACLICVP